MWRRPSHVELNVSDLEVGILLENARSQLEVGHEERIEKHLVVDIICSCLLEVFHDCLFDDI